MSWFQWGEERVVSPDSTMKLVRCPDCPSTSLVPLSEMTRHIGVLHRGEGFRCAVCKFSDIIADFLSFDKIKEHLTEVHRVTDESCYPSSIILPANLMRWSCKICQDCTMKAGEELVIQHISEVHGGFFLKRPNSRKAVCRVCLLEGTEADISQHVLQHRTEGFAHMEEEEEEDATVEEPRQSRYDRSRANSGIFVRGDLFSTSPVMTGNSRPVKAPQKKNFKQEKNNFPDSGPSLTNRHSVAQSVSAKNTRIIKRRRSRSRSPSSSDSESARTLKKSKKKCSSSSRSSRSPSRTRQGWRSVGGSSSSGQKIGQGSQGSFHSRHSGSGSQSNHGRYYRKPTQVREVGLTTYYSYSPPPSSSHQPRDSRTPPRSSQAMSSRSPPRASQAMSFRTPPRGSRTLSPRYSEWKSHSRSPGRREYRSPSRLTARDYIYRSPPSSRLSNNYRSPSRISPKREYLSPLRRSPVAYISPSRTSPRREYRSPSRISPRLDYRSPPRNSPRRDYNRISPRISPRRDYNRSPPRISPRRDRSPPRISPRRDYRSPSRSSPRRDYRSPLRRSPRRDYNRSPPRISPRRDYRSPSKRYPRQEYKSPSRSPIQQTRQASYGSDFMVVGTGPGKKFKCQVCNTVSDSKLQHDQHKDAEKHQKALARVNSAEVTKYFCEICDVHCTGDAPFQQHLAGKVHRSKESAQSSHQEESPDHHLFQCPACKEGFQKAAKLREHVKNSHDIVIICKECEALGHNPVGQVLLCSELIDHYNQIHNKEMTPADLPFYGRKRQAGAMRPQGYVMCKLCPWPSYNTLGSPGLWINNEPNMTTIKNHFKKFHPDNVRDFQERIVLGCQLCLDQLPGTRDLSLWRALLDKHRREEGEGEGAGPPEKSARTVKTNLCPYCGDTVGKGAAGQSHIKRQHLHLTFACKLCQLSDRFYFPSLEDVFRHLELNHLKISRNNSQIVFPGSKSNLSAFAWVKCKTCDFRGVGHGREVRNHLRSHLGSGEENLEIFCRICHRDDKALGIFEDFQEFIIHFEENHSDIVPFLHDQRLK